MHRFIEGEDRMQPALLPHCLEDYVDEENPVRVIEASIDELDLAALGFSGMTPAATGRPAYHPLTLLQIYLYGYLNRIQSSRRLEREAQRNVELMWLTGRLAPDFKTIADFRKDHGTAIRNVCREFILLCRRCSCSPTASSRSMEASSRRSTTGTRTSATARSRCEGSSSSTASTATSLSSIVPTASPSLCSPIGSRVSSRGSARFRSRCASSARWSS